MSKLILEPPVPLPLGGGETTGPVAGGSSQEPVAWRIFDGEGGYDFRDELPSEESQAWSARYGRKWEPLFAAPPSRKPLTDEEVRKVVLSLDRDEWGFAMRVARAIERAHGIKGEQE